MLSDSGKTVLECVECQKRYSLLDIINGRYWMETLVCSRCYARMQQAPYSKSCFGKPMLQLSSGRRLYGYNPQAWECREACPDREICRRVVFGKGNNGNAKL